MTAPRNVVFICTDQQRKDSLGCYGHPSAVTPHLDGLAAGGLRCEHDIVANPICMPNRMSMLTGQHPRNHGLWTNGLLLERLPLTLPEHLHQQGWRTASFGKIHLTPTGTGEPSWEGRKRWEAIGRDAYQHTGPYAGFEHVELTIGHNSAPRAHYGAWFYEHGGDDGLLDIERDPGIHDTCGKRAMPIALHPTTFVAERASAWITERAAVGEAFFAHVSFPDPHHPFDPPREAADAVDAAAEPEAIPARGGLADRPSHYAERRAGRWSRRGLRETADHPDGPPAEHIRIMRARTTAMVNLIDQGVGRVVAALDAAGVRDQTLIVFTSDHGDALGDHGLMGKGPWGYRSIINTPLIINGPGVDVGVSTRVISDVDLAPSICGAIGATPLPFADGIDVWSHWQDASQPTRDAALIESRNGYGALDYASAALATSDATYIRYQDGVEELTDLTSDPDEHINRIADDPDAGAPWRARLLDHLLSTQSRGPEQVSHA